MLELEQRALLGDHEAARRLTDAGCWCRVRSAGGTIFLNGNLPVYLGGLHIKELISTFFARTAIVKLLIMEPRKRPTLPGTLVRRS